MILFLFLHGWFFRTLNWWWHVVNTGNVLFCRLIELYCIIYRNSDTNLLSVGLTVTWNCKIMYVIGNKYQCMKAMSNRLTWSWFHETLEESSYGKWKSESHSIKWKHKRERMYCEKRGAFCKVWYSEKGSLFGEVCWKQPVGTRWVSSRRFD